MTPADLAFDAGIYERPEWLIDAAALLAEPDPGPTPWLVEGLIVDQAIAALVGKWKTTKSYATLDIGVSIATGEPAFGVLAIPNPGPVIYICEESGKAALRRRLDALCCGRAIDPERLRGRLHVATNARLKLDESDCQRELVTIGLSLRPRLFVFDPLVRMKSAGRDENAQKEMAAVIEFIRTLRDETGAAVAFVHHTGHAGGNMRGTSDLESVWESRIAWSRHGQEPLVTLQAEHREAEAAEPITYRIKWDSETRMMRFDVEEKLTPAEKRVTQVVAYLEARPNERPSRNQLLKAIGGNRNDTLASIRLLIEHGAVRDEGGLSLVPLDGAGGTGIGTRPYKGAVPIRPQYPTPADTTSVPIPDSNGWHLHELPPEDAVSHPASPLEQGDRDAS